MQVNLDLPEDIAPLLGDSPMGIGRAALEALTLESLRTGKVTEAQARRMLGFNSRYEMDGFLKKHGLLLPISAEDVEHDAATASAFVRR